MGLRGPEMDPPPLYRKNPPNNIWHLPNGALQKYAHIICIGALCWKGGMWRRGSGLIQFWTPWNKIKQGDFFFKYIDGNTMNTFVFLLLTTFFWYKLYNTGSHYSSKELILFTLTRISNLYMAGENVEAKNFEQSCLRSITDFGDSSKMILW